MKKFLFLLTLIFGLVAFSENAAAQSSLAGQTFTNENILAGLFDNVEPQIQKARQEQIERIKKDKKREPNAKELADIDKRIAEAQSLTAAMRKGTVIGISVKFLSEAEAEMHTDIRIDDAALKAAGIGWVKRKAMKMALKVMPKSIKAPYVRRGDIIIISPKDDPDTLRINPDGTRLSGNFDPNTPFILTRQSPAPKPTHP